MILGKRNFPNLIQNRNLQAGGTVPGAVLRRAKRQTETHDQPVEGILLAPFSLSPTLTSNTLYLITLGL